MSLSRIALLILAFFIATSTASADKSVTFGAMKDATLFGPPSTNNSGGGSPGMFVGNNMMSQTRRALIAFDIANYVPDGATITGVELTLYVGNAPNNSPPQTIHLHPLTKDWGEGTVGSDNANFSGSGAGAAAADGDATWAANFKGTSNWTNPGGDFGPSSASAVAPLANTANLNAAVKWLTTEALVADAQGWLDDPATNFGWALKNDTETGSQTVRGFYTRLAGDVNSPTLDDDFRPSLTVTYIPEPTTVVLLLLGLPFALGARRR